MKIFVSAAEISSDLHAARLMDKLCKKYSGEPFQVFGIGGQELKKRAYFKPIYDAEQLRVMGFTEILSRLSAFREALSACERAIRSERPDVIFTFDYPDFHFRLMSRIRDVSAFRWCGIPPKVWVWRSHRVEKLRQFYDALWVIFPFEKKFYQDKGLDVVFTGNPLISDQVQRWSKIEKNPLQIALFVGSRPAEIRRNLGTIGQFLSEWKKKHGSTYTFVAALPEGLSGEEHAQALELLSQWGVTVSVGDSGRVLAQSQVGLIKSGTSTLEAAVLGCAPVVYYQASFLSTLIFKFVVRYRGPVGLCNILLGTLDRREAVFPEVLGPEITSAVLVQHVEHLLSASRDPNSPEHLAMRTLSDLFREDVDADFSSQFDSRFLFFKRNAFQHRRRNWGVWVGSLLWSGLNCLYRKRPQKQDPSPFRVTLIGNLQSGGAGKTQIVKALLRSWIDQDEGPLAVVTRGYRSRAEQKNRLVRPGETVSLADIGDEALEIRQAFPQVYLAVGEDREKSLQELRRVLPRGARIILDDGFQSYRGPVEKTVLAVTDGDRDQVFYRDFDHHVRRADAVVFTKGYRWHRWGLWRKDLIFPIKSVDSKILDFLPNRSVWVWSGLGMPEDFVKSIERTGAVVQKTFVRADHAVPSVQEWVDINQSALENQVKVLISAKDAVRWDGELPSEFIIFQETWTLPDLQ